MVNNPQNRKGAGNKNEKVERPQKTLLRTFGPGPQTSAAGPFRWDPSCVTGAEGGVIWLGNAQHHQAFRYPKGKTTMGGITILLSSIKGDPTAQRTSSSGCEAKSTIKMNSSADQYHNPDPLVRLIGQK